MSSNRLLVRVRSIARIPTFLAAAGIRRLFVSEGVPDWDSIATDFHRLTPPSRLSSTSRGLITYHPWYQGFETGAVHKCLSEAAALGTTFLRSDVRWGDLMPDGKNINERALAWYLAYFQAVRDGYGMEPMIVLSNPPRKSRRFTPKELRTSWNTYLRHVLDRFRNVCSLYQVLNEINNPLYRIFPRSDIASVVSSAGEIIHRQIPGARVVVNILAGVFNWSRDAHILLDQCGSAIDVLGLDYYPGTWSLTDVSDWSEIEDFIRGVNSSAREELPRTCDLAILETGYASNIPFLRGPRQQEKYFRDWKNVIPGLEIICQSGKLAYVGIYELCDASSSTWLDPEAHFGLLDSRTLARKAAFDEVHQLFSSLA